MDRLSKIIITNNNQLDIDNIIKIKSFNTEEFVLETSNGIITITGEGLDMESINTSTNKSCIKGVFHKIVFGEDKYKKKKEENFFKKLVK